MAIKERARAVRARFARTRILRAWKRYGDRRGNRLAGATSFFGFLSMFPLIVLAGAITVKLLGADQLAQLKSLLVENLPGLADKIDLDSLVANAGTIGWISGASLLLTGLGWIDSLRASIRSMHELDDQPGNLLQLKLADSGALLGLGLIGLIATASSSILSGLSERIVEWAGLEGSWLADWGLEVLSIVLGILSGALLFLYLQTGMPRIILPRKVAMIAALAGGILFVGAQKLGSVYVDRVIGNNQAYGALAVPLALLVWIYLMTRAIMLIAAWTKEATLDHQGQTAEALAASTAPAGTPTRRAGDPAPRWPGDLIPGPAGTKYKVVPIPERKADGVAVAAGAVLGATATAIAVTLSRAVWTFFRRP